MPWKSLIVHLIVRLSIWGLWKSHLASVHILRLKWHVWHPVRALGIISGIVLRILAKLRVLTKLLSILVIRRLLALLRGEITIVLVVVLIYTVATGVSIVNRLLQGTVVDFRRCLGFPCSFGLTLGSFSPQTLLFFLFKLRGSFIVLLLFNGHFSFIKLFELVIYFTKLFYLALVEAAGFWIPNHRF